MKKLILALFAVFLLAGCLGGQSPTPTPVATAEPTAVPTVEITPPPVPTEAPSVEPTPVFEATNQVAIIYGGFSPERIKVAAGTKVTWENQESALHSVDAKDGSFSSGYIAGRQSWSYTFNTQGTFEYSDETAGGKTGFVMVE